MKVFAFLLLALSISSCSDDKAVFVGKWFYKKNQDSIPSVKITKQGDRLVCSIEGKTYPTFYDSTQKEMVVHREDGEGCLVYDFNYHIKYLSNTDELSVTQTPNRFIESKPAKWERYARYLR